MTFSGRPGLVTVVMPSYNHAEFLEQRMESLIGQTYQDIEILVIDDCSTDNSLEILRKYEAYPKVELIAREKNAGWVVVNNQGIDLSAGEFVIFAQCDDDCDPRMIERLVDGMKANPTAGITFCRSLLVDEHNHTMGDDFAGRERAFRARCSKNTLVSGAEMSHFLLHSCVIPNLSAALFKKECFDTVGKFTSAYRACGDWDLFFRIANHYDVAYIAEPLNKFRQHETTIRSYTKGRATYEEFFRVLLGQIAIMDLTFFERCRFRTRVMYLWCTHLLSNPLTGLLNFPYHLSRILQLDPIALAFFAPGLILCTVKIVEKIFLKLWHVQDI